MPSIGAGIHHPRTKHVWQYLVSKRRVCARACVRVRARICISLWRVRDTEEHYSYPVRGKSMLSQNSGCEVDKTWCGYAITACHATVELGEYMPAAHGVHLNLGSHSKSLLQVVRPEPVYPGRHLGSHYKTKLFQGSTH